MVTEIDDDQRMEGHDLKILGKDRSCHPQEQKYQSIPVDKDGEASHFAEESERTAVNRLSRAGG